MALEAFLINPYRTKSRRRRGISRGVRRGRRGGGLPSALLSRMIKQHGVKRGMKEAWRSFKSGSGRKPIRRRAVSRRRIMGRNRTRSNAWPGERKRHRRAASVGWSQRTVGIGGYKKPTGGRYPKWNPFGEEVMIVGANPRRRRRRTRSRRRNSAYPVMFNPRRRRNRQVSVNRRRRSYGRRYRRRNPASASLPAISFKNPMGMLMPAAIGTLGFLATQMIPSKIGMDTTPLTRFGVKAAVLFGGSMAVGRFMGRRNSIFFAVGSGINLLTDILKTYVFTGGQLGAFPYQEGTAYGAFPQYFQGDVGEAASPYDDQ